MTGQSALKHHHSGLRDLQGAGGKKCAWDGTGEAR
jgi:hypothetical protein